VPYTVTTTPLSGVLVLEPTVHRDARGFFLESFNAIDFERATGITATFVQDNHSQSTKGILRGLHYQVEHPQGKLVRVTRGEVFDVCVNLQRHHPEFGKWAGIRLNEENKRQLWIPPGFAHGFLVLSDVADFQYKTTDYYTPVAEKILAWNDPQVGVEWPLSLLGEIEPVLTLKDKTAPCLNDVEVFP
jgi:dTDP-4-dehydrorhamnose 3,5-epimerase